MSAYSTEPNRVGYVFHCQFDGCREVRGLKLVPKVIRKGIHRYFWRCEVHR